MFKENLNTFLINKNINTGVLDEFLDTYVFFLIGCYAYKYLISYSKFPHQQKKTALITGLCLLIGNVIQYNIGFSLRGFQFVLAVIGCVFIVYVSQIITNESWITYLGRYSLPIYVLHDYFIIAMKIALSKLNLNDAIGIVPMVLSTSVSIILSLTVFWISKKIWKLEAIFYPGKYIDT